MARGKNQDLLHVAIGIVLTILLLFFAGRLLRNESLLTRLGWIALAVLLIAYSDGSEGTLVISCNGGFAPASIFEGITATKGYVDYWNREAPVGGVDADRTIFHVI